MNPASPAITYNGGKGHLYRHLINLMPPHEIYVEPFLGYGAVLRHKRPAEENIGIDLDRSALETVAKAIGYKGRIGRGLFGEWQECMNGVTWTFHEMDAITWLSGATWFGHELLYCDPPYPFSTRSAGSNRRYYRFEMTDQQHIDLLNIIRPIPCPVIISSYHSELYADMLTGWNLDRVQVRTRQGTAEECIWYNFPRPSTLHDTRYLGSNFRERERIHRMQQRWVRRLNEMNPLQRQALIAAIAEAGLIPAP